VGADDRGLSLDRHQAETPGLRPGLDRPQECIETIHQDLGGVCAFGRRRHQLCQLAKRSLILALQQGLEQVGEGAE